MIKTWAADIFRNGYLAHRNRIGKTKRVRVWYRQHSTHQLVVVSQTHVENLVVWEYPIHKRGFVADLYQRVDRERICCWSEQRVNRIECYILWQTIPLNKSRIFHFALDRRNFQYPDCTFGIFFRESYQPPDFARRGSDRDRN